MKIADRPPMTDVLDALEKMAATVYRYTGKRGITRLSLDSEFGLMNGLIPGTSATVWTSCGPVEVYCERRLDLEYKEHEQLQFEPPSPVDADAIQMTLRAYVNWCPTCCAYFVEPHYYHAICKIDE